MQNYKDQIQKSGGNKGIIACVTRNNYCQFFPIYFVLVWVVII